MANAAGTTVWKWDQQEAFGDSVPNENPSGLGAFQFPLRFAGTYADPETGGLQNDFRDLEPGIGRYKRSDPLGLRGGLNTYTHVRSNPLMYSDPRGLAPVCIVTPRGGLVCTDVPGGASGGGAQSHNPPSGGEVIPFPGGRDRPSNRDRPSERPDRNSGTASNSGNDCRCKFTGKAEVVWAPPADPGYEHLSPHGGTGYQQLKCWYRCRSGWGYTLELTFADAYGANDAASLCAPEVDESNVTMVHGK